MTLKASINADPTKVFLNTDEFAESVTYKPHRFRTAVGRADRSISAVVFRHRLQTQDQLGEAVVPVFEVHVHNDSTTGISSTELDLGGDKIALSVRDGETATDRTITELVTQDAGMLVLQCQ